MRSRAAAESLGAGADAGASPCDWATDRKNRSCRPYRRHHRQISTCNHKPNRRDHVSGCSSISDWVRAAARQFGERSAQTVFIFFQ